MYSLVESIIEHAKDGFPKKYRAAVVMRPSHLLSEKKNN